VELLARVACHDNSLEWLYPLQVRMRHLHICGVRAPSAVSSCLLGVAYDVSKGPADDSSLKCMYPLQVRDCVRESTHMLSEGI
jgi:hypothetical protein